MNNTNKSHGSNGIALSDTDVEAVTGGFLDNLTAQMKAALAALAAPPPKGSGGAVPPSISDFVKVKGGGLVPVTAPPSTGGTAKPAGQPPTYTAHTAGTLS